MSAVSVNVHIEPGDAIDVALYPDGHGGYVCVTDAAIHVQSVEILDKLVGALTELRELIEPESTRQRRLAGWWHDDPGICNHFVEANGDNPPSCENKAGHFWPCTYEVQS